MHIELAGYRDKSKFNTGSSKIDSFDLVPSYL